MKKLIIGLLLTSGIGQAQAYEIPENPDRRMSFGFSYDRTHSSTEYNFGRLKIEDYTKGDGNEIFLDMRAPLNSFLTFSLRGGFLFGSSETFAAEKLDSKGYDVGFTARVYLP